MNLEQLLSNKLQGSLTKMSREDEEDTTSEGLSSPRSSLTLSPPGYHAPEGLSSPRSSLILSPPGYHAPGPGAPAAGSLSQLTQLQLSSRICVTNSHAGRESKNPQLFSSIAKMFACNTCSAMFTTRSELYTHYKDVHYHKLFTCSYCDKLFTRSSSLKTHIRIHTGDRPYQCSDCGKSFTQLSNVLQHNRDVHIKDKRFKCNMCNKGFSRLETLQCHIRVHTGERIYKCEVCQKSFSQRANLKVHTRIHRGERTRPKRQPKRQEPRTALPQAKEQVPQVPHTEPSSSLPLLPISAPPAPDTVINRNLLLSLTYQNNLQRLDLLQRAEHMLRELEKPLDKPLTFRKPDAQLDLFRGLDCIVPTVAIKLLFDTTVTWQLYNKLKSGVLRERGSRDFNF